MIRASIIIVTYGQRELTAQCLRSLERCLGDRLGTDWELVLVDNASPDDTPELLRRWSDRAIVRLLSENRNFAGGCNVGAAEAHGEVLVFLNNDTEVTPGALETLVEQALEPGVSVAGCRLLFPDGTLQHAGVAFIRGKALGGAAMPQHVFHHQDQELAGGGASYEADCVTAACMAVRASTFADVGGFDEGYRNGLEDVDLCLKIRVAAQKIVYRGDVTVVHHEGASRGKGEQLWATPAKIEAMRHNDLLFTGRWAAALDQDDALAEQVWDAALQDGPLPRLVTTADVVVLGQPSGIGPAADEARALLAAFHGRGHLPAAVDWPVPTVVPRLHGQMGALLPEARRRAPVPDAWWLLVPCGEHDRHRFYGPTVVRLASPRTAAPLEQAIEIWAASPAVADALRAAGVAAAKLRLIPPVVLGAPHGPGGAGVLAILPVHIPALARSVLAALRGVLACGNHVRLLPTVWSRTLEREVSEILPGAELLRPCSDEARFAALAGTADVVVAADPSDRYERRALVAAATGASIVTPYPAGPAAFVLAGSGAIAVAGELEGLGRAAVALLGSPGERAACAERVVRTCAPPRLPESVAPARAVAA